MARSLGYTPPTLPDTSARDELADLVDALHDSGLTRALAGSVRSYPRLLHTLLDMIDADVVRSLISLGSVVRGLDPDAAERLATGLRRARSDVVTAAARPPEGPRQLWRRLRDPDTRRGLAATWAALSAVGAALGRDDEQQRA